MSHIKRIANYAGIMILLSVLLKPLGIFKDMLVASNFGVSSDLGIYFLFFGVSTFFSSLMYSMHRGSITPAYIKIKLSGDNSLAYSLAVLSGVVYMLVIAVFCCILYVFIEPLIHFFAPGFSADKVQAASRFAVPLTLLLASMAANDFFTSLLEAEQRFISTRLAQACISISLIAIILLYHQEGWSILLQGLALGYAISATIQVILYITIIRYSRINIFKAIQQMKSILPLWPPMALSAMVANCSGIIDRMMITMLGGHELAIFGYADTLVSNINSILLLSINTAVLPVFSAISADKRNELCETVFKTYSYVFALLLPVVMVINVYGDIFIKIIYQHGSFSKTDTDDVFHVLGFLIIAIIPSVGVILLARVYNVLLDAKITLYAALIATSLKVSFNYIFMQSYGVTGIAMSTVFASVIIVLFFTLMLSIKYRMQYHVRGLLGFIAMLVTGVIIWYASTWCRQYGLPASVAAFILAYLICIFTFRLREYQQGFSLVYNKTRAFIPYQ